MEHQEPMIVCALYAAPLKPNITPIGRRRRSQNITHGPKRRLEFDATSLSNKKRRCMFNETGLDDTELRIMEHQRLLILCALHATPLQPNLTLIGRRPRSQIIGHGPKRHLEFDPTSSTNQKRKYMFNETNLDDVKFKVTFSSHQTVDGRDDKMIRGSVKNGKQYVQKVLQERAPPLQQDGGDCTDLRSKSGIEYEISRLRKGKGKIVQEQKKVNNIELVAPLTPSPAKLKRTKGSITTRISHLRSKPMIIDTEKVLKEVAKKAENAHYYTRLLNKLVKNELMLVQKVSNQLCTNTNQAPNSIGQLTDDRSVFLKGPKKKKNNKLLEPDFEREAIKAWKMLLRKKTSESFGAPSNKDDGISREVSFIINAGSIQGSRVYMVWRGSVLDSVIGALLTQRVGDNFSSSAFMSLGMIFPQNPACDMYSRHHRMLREKRSNACSSKQLRSCGSTSIFSHAQGNVSKLSKQRTSFDEKNKKNSQKGRVRQKEKPKPDWDSLRRVCISEAGEDTGLEQNSTHIDFVDWYAVMRADVEDIAEAISRRGMNRKLAARIKDILNRLMLDHGNLDLEWLRSANPQEAKGFLLSIYGLGLKSAECVRLLTLRQPAFPVDVNVARVTVRLGWVPTTKISDKIQMYLLKQNSVLHDLIHRYLWLRLWKLDKDTLYQLHYQMITLGKVFCTNQNPNCGQCPLRMECRYHSNLADRPTPGFQAMDIEELGSLRKTVTKGKSAVSLLESEGTKSKVKESVDVLPFESYCIVPPKTPIKVQLPRCKSNTYKKITSVVRQSNRSKTSTEHYIYELPDWHPILETFDDRDPDDSSPYLLIPWETGHHDFKRTGETSAKNKTPSTGCVKESRSVLGTIMIPYRTALRASIPLNATYFQTNEVFADHQTSQTPVDVPRKTLQGAPRKTLYCGTSLSEIVKGQSANEISSLFKEGYICTRTFDRETYDTRSIRRLLHQSSHIRKRTTKR